MNNFRETLGQFRETLHQEGEHAAIPSLQTLLARDRPVSRNVKNLKVRLAAAVAGIALMLAAIPAYQNAQRQREQLDQENAQEKAQEKADALLMEQINANLSRSVPRAMAPLVNMGAGK